MRLRRRRATPELPFDAAWEVPQQFNFTRDVVERLAADPLLPALTHVDEEGIVDRRTFAELAQDAARWANLLRSKVGRGDRVLLVAGHVHGWHAILLGALKGGVVLSPADGTIDADELTHRVTTLSPRLVLADRASEEAAEQMLGRIPGTSLLYLDDAAEQLRTLHGRAPTEETTALEPALVLFGHGPGGPGVVHHHASTWAASQLGEHWLDAEPGDLVWVAAPTGSAELVWGGALAPWSRGAEVLAHALAFEPEERIGLVQRLGVTVLAQSADDHAQVAAVLPELPVPRTNLMRLISFDGRVEPAVADVLEEELELAVAEAVCLPELPLLVGALAGRQRVPGALGEGLPGHDLGLVDATGSLVGAGVEGELAVHGRPPLLFHDYLDGEASRHAVSDGWFLTGLRAVRDPDGVLWPADGVAERTAETDADRAALVAAAAERARSARREERERREREDAERREAELRAEEERARAEEEARLEAERVEREAREAAERAEQERLRLEREEREAAQRAEEERRRHEEAERE
ncbi:MAG: AMP-binding protein, partial [Gaiella sp.]